MKKDLFRWLFTGVALFSILLIYSCAKGPSDIGGPDYPPLSTGENRPYEKEEDFMGEGGQEQSPGVRADKEEFDRRPWIPEKDEVYLPGAEGDYEQVPLPDEREHFDEFPLPGQEGDYEEVPFPGEEGDYEEVPFPDEEGDYEEFPLPDEEGDREQYPVPDEEDPYEKEEVLRQYLRAYMDPVSDIYKDAYGVADSRYAGIMCLKVRDLPSLAESERFLCVFEDLETGQMLEVGSFTIPGDSAHRRYEDSDGTGKRPEEGDPTFRDREYGRESGTTGEWYEVVLRWEEDPVCPDASSRGAWDNLYVYIWSIYETGYDRAVLGGDLLRIDESSDPSYE